MRKELQPWRALACAVIWQAVEDASLAEIRNEKSAAAGWMFDGPDEPLTFLWWCEVANLDPDNIRRRVLMFYAEYAHLALHGEFWNVLDEEKVDEVE